MLPPTLPDSAAERALGRYLTGFAACTVLVLGDVMLDRYVLGEVRRISPEAPIPVLRAQTRRAVPGGAGNVAQNVASLGARAILLGVVGDDVAADELAAVLGQTGGIAARLLRVPGRASTVKTRFMSGGHQLLRLDEEVADPIAAEVEERLLAAFHAALSEADIVILSDYEKGCLTDQVLRTAIAAARAAGLAVVVDPKRARFEAYAGASVITPNVLEVSRATGFAAQSNAGAVQAGEAALVQAGAEAVLVKRSERGLTLVRRDAAPLHVPTRAVEVADVSGAGDTLVTAFALMLACGADLPEAALLANIAAGIAVAKHGTASVSRAELAAILHRDEVLAIDGKIVDLAGAVARVGVWQANGERVGVTNGCFDLIHPGHVRLLQSARAACDRLVVALNTDASVRRLKGPDRPVQNEAARATVMASMAAADLVLLFDEDTPEQLIRAIRPDVLIKGADYRVDQVVGADFVQSYGGKVELIGIEQGHSTTDTIRRINQGGA